MPRYDLLLKGGTVNDGQRTPRFTSDVAIVDGRIAQIGGVSESDAARVFDARDLIVAPGFIDLHTHFDSQLFWDPYCTMSGWHGVTSVVIGNCGFGFAPVKPEHRERSMLTLERNEAVRASTMAAGMPWDWVTFPEFLNSVERTPKGVNVLSYMGLSPVMSWVMGLDDAKGRPATADEQKKMSALLGEAMDAGACGFSAQILGPDSVRRDYDGTPMITDIMAPDDLIAFAHVLREKRRGFIQVLGGDFELFEKVAEISGRPVIWNTLEFAHDQHGNTYGSYQDILRWLEKGNAQGLRLFGHAVTCPIDIQFSLEDWDLFDSYPIWREVTMGSVPERMSKMRDPGLRQALRDEFDRLAARRDAKPDKPVGLFLGIPKMLVAEAKTPQLRELEGYTVGEIAARDNKHPVDAFLDIALAEDLGTFFTSVPPPRNQDGGDAGGHQLALRAAGAFGRRRPYEVPDDRALPDRFHQQAGPGQRTDGLGAGALAAFGLLGHGGRVHRPWLPARRRPRRHRGLRLRRTALPAPERIHDFPADDWRLAQKAEGYRLTIVNGEVTFEDGECTGATPGALLRHGRTA